MFLNELEEYRDIIYDKLVDLERKIKLSYSGSQNKDKLAEFGKNLNIIKQTIDRLENNTLSWEDLAPLGISKQSILEHGEKKNTDKKRRLEDFNLLANIPIECLLEENIAPHAHELNILYSIIEYININYQTLFTQKSLLSSAKTSYIREKFYLQHQDILRIFNSVKHFFVLSAKKSQYDQELLFNKEFLILLKKIYFFLTGIVEYINIIQKESTFDEEDFQQLITSTDKDINIYGLTLDVALKECKNFVEEALEYISMTNRDIFDSFRLAQDNGK